MTAMKTAEAWARRMKKGTEDAGRFPPPSPHLGPPRPRSTVLPRSGPTHEVLLSSVLFLSFLELFHSPPLPSVPPLSLFSLFHFLPSHLQSPGLDWMTRSRLTPPFPSFRYASHMRYRDTIGTTNCIDINILRCPNIENWILNMMQLLEEE